MIAEAEDMLAALADDIAEHGGQPISVEPLPHRWLRRDPLHRPQPGRFSAPGGAPRSGAAAEGRSARLHAAGSGRAEPVPGPPSS